MSKQKRTSQPSLSEMTADELKALDPDTLVGMLLRVLDQNRQLSELLQQFVREKHGPKTEHFDNPEQLRIFDSEQIDQPAAHYDSSTSPPSSQPETKAKNPRKGHNRNPMPAHLDRKRITGPEPPASDLTCKQCASMFQKVSEVCRNSRYESIPSTVLIEDFMAMIYQCPGCGDTITVEPPVQTIENGMAGPALLADIAVAKFEDHMPWHRQEQRFARMCQLHAQPWSAG